jgi:hypothetical protein
MFQNKNCELASWMCLKYNNLTLYIIFLIKITNNYLKANRYLFLDIPQNLLGYNQSSILP